MSAAVDRDTSSTLVCCRFMDRSAGPVGGGWLWRGGGRLERRQEPAHRISHGYHFFNQFIFQ